MIGGWMQQYLGAAQHEHARGLWVHDFTAGHHCDIAKIGLGNGEGALDTVAFEVAIHEIVRRAGLHGVDATIFQYHIARRRDEKRGVEVSPGPFRIALIGIGANPYFGRLRLAL